MLYCFPHVIFQLFIWPETVHCPQIIGITSEGVSGVTGGRGVFHATGAAALKKILTKISYEQSFLLLVVAFYLYFEGGGVWSTPPPADTTLVTPMPRIEIAL